MNSNQIVAACRSKHRRHISSSTPLSCQHRKIQATHRYQYTISHARCPGHRAGRHSIDRVGSHDGQSPDRMDSLILISGKSWHGVLGVSLIIRREKRGRWTTVLISAFRRVSTGKRRRPVPCRCEILCYGSYDSYARYTVRITLVVLHELQVLELLDSSPKLKGLIYFQRHQQTSSCPYHSSETRWSSCNHIQRLNNRLSSLANERVGS